MLSVTINQIRSNNIKNQTLDHLIYMAQHNACHAIQSIPMISILDLCHVDIALECICKIEEMRDYDDIWHTFWRRMLVPHVSSIARGFPAMNPIIFYEYLEGDDQTPTRLLNYEVKNLAEEANDLVIKSENGSRPHHLGHNGLFLAKAVKSLYSGMQYGQYAQYFKYIHTSLPGCRYFDPLPDPEKKAELRNILIENSGRFIDDIIF